MIRRRQTGDKLAQFTLGEVNQIIDAANLVLGDQGSGRGPGPRSAAPATVLIRNDSGADCVAYDVLGLDAPLIAPDDAAGVRGFKQRIMLSGVVPTVEHVGRFAVLTEPIADGRIGRATIAGAGIAYLRIDEADHQFAEVEAGTTFGLVTTTSGTAAILWKETVTSPGDWGWAIVRIGGGAGSAAGAACFAKITAVQGGTSPFLYSATEQQPAGNGWQNKSGGRVWSSNLRNLAEIGGSGAAELPVNSIVMIWVDSAGRGWFDRLHYRGTYA